MDWLCILKKNYKIGRFGTNSSIFVLNTLACQQSINEQYIHVLKITGFQLFINMTRELNITKANGTEF